MGALGRRYACSRMDEESAVWHTRAEELADTNAWKTSVSRMVVGARDTGTVALEHHQKASG